MKQGEQKRALDDIRVLDLAGPSGSYCAKLLADLGADVIRIEPPGGDETRSMGPFFHDDPDPEKSLHFFHFNANKRGITLNLETAEGRQIFRDLVKTADVVVETFVPGYLASIGLDYEAIKAINPRVILVSITWFGQTGPYSGFQSSDLVTQANIGLMVTIGFPEDPPAGIGASQTYHMASTHGAMGALMALYQRDMSGRGQWVDIPVHGSCLRMAEMVALMYWLDGSIRKRSGFEYYRGLQDVWACKDGYVICSVLGGFGADSILEWMDAEGMAADLRSEAYTDVVQLIKGHAPGGRGAKNNSGGPRLKDMQDAKKHVEEVWQAFLMVYSKEDLLVGAQSRGVTLMPVNTAKDVVEDIGLRARDYFVELDHPQLGAKLEYPGAPYRLAKTPWSLRSRAPAIGEHNGEVYRDLGLTSDRLSELKAANII